MPLYKAAFQKLTEMIYPCACSRKEIADSHRRPDPTDRLIYPGTCRNGLPVGKQAKSYRLRVPAEPHLQMAFHDRWYGPQEQDLTADVGDFILKRADSFWAYQLAVVVDDAAQGISHIVRGADLLDSTARQIYLQGLLTLPTPYYLHVPVLANEIGEQLSKQTGAVAFDLGDNNFLHDALLPAAQHLGLKLAETPCSIEQFWPLAVLAWSKKKPH
jgi:glutamyl-Q tRNA(Asp) synthetase